MRNQQITGNFYIRVRPTGWFVWYQSYKDGKRSQERVDHKAVADLGFKPTMSIDEAKAHCKQLNKERSLIKEKIRVAAKRITSLTTLDETLFPQERLSQFESLLEEENFGSQAHLEKIKSHFNFIQKMCNELRILPLEYRISSKRIYKYFISKKISANYSQRIISVLNRWGRFISRINGAYYDEVPLPRGRELSAIADAQITKRGTNTELGVRTASLPLTPEKLEILKQKMSLENYNWLKITVWLGVRPFEVGCFKNPKEHRIDFNIKTGLTVLHIYQSKLQSVSREKRWKKIPILFKEQFECIDIIKEGNFEKPSYKMMRKHCGEAITFYGGRKGFVTLMRSHGQTMDDISRWMGHLNTSTTRKDYDDKDIVNFTVSKETIVK